MSLTRDEALREITASDYKCDVLVIGGGATGLGTAVESASRGYRTLLIERDDFAKGTSSRSTKLVHGGVRYLAQFNIPLVLDALRERGYMLRNAPHLVHKLSFVVPAYSYSTLPYYGLGLKTLRAPFRIAVIWKIGSAVSASDARYDAHALAIRTQGRNSVLGRSI